MCYFKFWRLRNEQQRHSFVFLWSVPSSRKEKEQTSKKVNKKDHFSGVKGESVKRLTDWQRSGGNKDLFAQMASELMLNDEKTSFVMADESTGLQAGIRCLRLGLSGRGCCEQRRKSGG